KEIAIGKKLAEYPPVSDLPPGINGWIKVNSNIISNTQLQSIFKNVSIASISSLEDGNTDEKVINDAVEAGQDFIADLRNLGTGIISNKAIQEGRQSTFDEHKNEIVGYQYDATLENSCDYCADLDG